MRRSVSFKGTRFRTRSKSRSRSRSIPRRKSMSKKSKLKKKLNFEKKISKIVMFKTNAHNTYNRMSNLQSYSNFTNSATSPAQTGAQILVPFTFNTPSVFNEIYAATGSTSTTLKMSICGTTFDLHISNRTTAPAVVKLYNFVARRDVPASASGVTTLVADSITKQSLVPSGSYRTPSQYLPGYSVFQNREFCVYFKVLKVVTRILQPGGVYIHTVKSKRRFEIERCNDTSTLLVAKKGITGGIYLQSYGMPTNDSKASTVMSTEAVQLDTAFFQRYNYSLPGDTSYNTVQHDDSGSFPTTVVGQEAQVTGLVQPLAIA